MREKNSLWAFFSFGKKRNKTKTGNTRPRPTRKGKKGEERNQKIGGKKLGSIIRQLADWPLPRGPDRRSCGRTALCSSAGGTPTQGLRARRVLFLPFAPPALPTKKLYKEKNSPFFLFDFSKQVFFFSSCIALFIVVVVVFFIFKVSE